MVERPVGIVQTAGRILTEVVFDRTHGRLNSPASGSGSPVPRSRDLVSRATGLWPQAWPPVAGSHRGFAAAVSSFASNQEMQVCKVGIDGCALAPLASARVEDGIENVRSATAHKPTKDCRDPHTRVMVRAGFSFQVNAQIPSDVMRGQQLLHQGTKLVPCDFIGFRQTLNTLGRHHDLLMANLFAQTKALAFGYPAPVGQPYRTFEGNRPSNTILADQLTPEILGALVALYEHSVFTQGVVWNVNPFDQYGVELGKDLVHQIIPSMSPDSDLPESDSSTMALLNWYRKG